MLFNDRITNAENTPAAIDEVWDHLMVLLLSKIADPTNFPNLRPITILPLLLKLFMYCLYLLMLPNDTLSTEASIGYRLGFQVQEMIHTTFAVSTIAEEGGLRLSTVPLDLVSAFDCLDHAPIRQAHQTRKVPKRITATGQYR